MMLLYYVLAGLLCLDLKHVTAFKQQSFRVSPKDVNAREGANVTLRCEINDIAGDCQWTKDGLALGYAAEIPGHPRHSMVIDSGNGVYNLLIRNVIQTDDALYQCQVSPGPAAGSKPIRSSARLTIMRPPSSVEIVDQSSDSILEVQENHEATIDCLARNSKPASKIIWFRGHVEINPEHRVDNITEEILGKTKLKLYTVHSQIKVPTTLQDDRLKYSCEARHEALSEPLKSSIEIRVLYPPSMPHIEGYIDGEIIDKGQYVNLRCVSKVGNPPAQLTWFKNNQPIQTEYRTSEKVSESTYSFIADVSDNNAKYRCEAKNSISQVPLNTDVVLSVSFASGHVKIKGPTEAKQGEIINLTCETGRSNPPSVINWLVAGEQERNSTSTVVTAPQSSWITKSNVSFVMPAGQRSVVATCQAVNNNPSDRVVATHKINVLYPPGAPIIIDYSSGNPILSGVVHKMSCLSTGGNPLASIAWYRNDKKVQSAITSNENSVSADLSFLVNITDNDATYKCETTHPALQIPLIKTIKLDVQFMPDHLHVKQEPVHLKPGTRATLTCEATSSNPAVKMSWWHEGIPVTEGINSFSKPGLHGGKLSTIQMTVNVTPEVDETVYTCQATSLALHKSIHREVTLNVLHKPSFESYPDQITSSEGDNLFVMLQTKGRPTHMTYKWFKDNEPLRTLHGLYLRDSNMNITGLVRDDAGNYTCEATNSEGSSSLTFQLTVKYKATVTNASVGVVVTGGQAAILWCNIDGFPLGAEHVTWTRPDFDFDGRTSAVFRNKTSYLTIINATRADAGSFDCVANNGLGNVSSLSASLVVEHKPEMTLLENEMKTASNAGVAAKLHCRAVGAPSVRFTWERDGSNITSLSDKYIVEEKQLDATRYESTLTILQVEQFDYGDYTCTASNHLGWTSSVNQLTVFSHPDPPIDLRTVNTTDTAVLLAWSPGFDGGEPANYRIRYRAFNKQTYKYEDLGNETQYLVTGLDPDTSYLFGVLAHNVYGDSQYTSESLRVTTTGGSPVTDSGLNKAGLDRGMYIVLVLLALVTGGLILLNIIVVTYCIHRRRRFNKRVNDNTDQSSKTPTIEMYAPNTYNAGYDENMSSISEKSETYSNVSPDYNDDHQQKSAVEQSYMIEQIDYPFINENDHTGARQHHQQYVSAIDINAYDHNTMAQHNVNDRLNLEDRVFRHQQQQLLMPPPPMPIIAETARVVPPLPVLHNRPPPAIPTSLTGKYYSQSPPPPDVTVFSTQNFLKTFAHTPSETDGHLV
ncbi:nephrin-like [Daktulosphaira vitifoliae]|uniref:nephrin-like n=1 Tax=Daktulosphaira vitifoliae TaxID=58002 RepID=UPI0021AABBEA|nr:nephrin-like [Daktulosphaira vitifoliae]